MKKLLKNVWMIAVLGALLASCSKSSDGLTNVIPHDSYYVVQVNTESIIKKADWNVFENPKISKNLGLLKIALEGKGSELFDAFMKDPNALGVDLKGKAYFYLSPSSAGLVLKVNDAKKLKDVLTASKVVNYPVSEKDGAFVYALSHGAAVAWNNKTMVFVSGEVSRNFGYMMSPKSQQSDLDIDVLALAQLSQDSKASINSLPTFSEFLKDCKDISVYANYQVDNIGNVLSNLGPDFPKEIAEELKSFKGMASGNFLSFDNGAITIESKAYFENSDAEKKMKELTESMMASTKGEQVKYLNTNPLFAVTASLKGEGVKNYLEKLGLWALISKQMDGNIKIVETVMTNLQGDVSFAIANVATVKHEYEGWDGQMKSYNRQLPEVAFFADCKDGKAIMDIIQGLIPEGMEEEMSSKIKKVNANLYSLDVDGTPGYMGVKDNMFFFTNVQSIYDNIAAGTKKDNIMSGLAKGNYITLAGDLQMLKEIVRSYENGFVGNEAAEFINLFDTYEFINKDGKTGNGKIKMKDGSKNSLAQICHYIDNLITRQMP